MTSSRTTGWMSTSRCSPPRRRDLDGQAQLHRQAQAGDPVQRRHAVQRAGGRHDVQRFMTDPGSLRTGNYASVASVTRAGAYTVVYHLKQRDSTFLGNTSVLSPTALASRGRELRRRSGLRRAVHVRPRGGGRQRHAGQVALVLQAAAASISTRSSTRSMPDANGGRRCARGRRHPGAEHRRADGLPAVQQRLGSARARQAAARLARASTSTSATGTASATAVPERRHAARVRARSCGRPSRRRSTARTLNKVVFGGLDVAELHADPAGEHRLVPRDQGPVHALRPRRRQEARCHLRLPEPDRPPADRAT